MVESQARPRQPEPAPRKPLRVGRWLLAGVLGAAVVAGGWSMWRWASDAERFPMRAVRLEGQLRHITEAELKAAIVPYLDSGMLGLDVRRIRESLEELPWVAEAGVRRQWPGTLVLVIRERQAVARWGGGALLSDDGVVFTPAPDTFPQGLPLLSGPADTQLEVRDRFQRIKALLATIGQEPLELHLDARRSWRAVLSDGVVIELGSGKGEVALERFVRSFAKISAPEGARIARVDLRYPNGFALAWHTPDQAPFGQGRK